jgi:CCR4-NOT transcription complex subunit 6
MEFFLPMFRKYGYEGFYKKKNNKYTAIVDGCATFIRRDRLECVEKTIIEFGDLVKHVPAKMSSEPEKWNELAKRRFRKDNIAQVMMLNFKSYGKKNSPDRRVCIANTHIHSQPANSDVKLWQVNYLLRTLKELVRKQETKVNDCIPLVLCGDFNSVPGSVVHSLLANGSVDPTHEDLKVDPCGVLQPTAMFQHNLPLASAYSSYNSHSLLMGCAGEPKSTTFACDFKGTLDYIFYTRTNLKVESLLELIGETAAGPNSSLPSYVWSSDHIALLAQLRWCSSSSLYRTSTATSDEINPDI